MKPGNKKDPTNKKSANIPSKEEDENKIPSSKAIKLDEDIRNDIIQTEVNPHVKKRTPLQSENHAINPEEVNEDQRIVNEQDDDQGINKYNSL